MEIRMRKRLALLITFPNVYPDTINNVFKV